MQSIRKRVEKGPSKYGVISESEKIVGESIVRAFFGTNFVDQKINGVPLSMALAEFTTEMFTRSRTFFNFLATSIIGELATKIDFTPADSRFKAKGIAIRKYVTKVIEERLQKPRTNDEPDFLQIYVNKY